MTARCIIVAGGSGTRMGASIPKQFLLLGGRPLLMYSIEAFREAVPDIPIILVLPEDQQDAWDNLCDQYCFDEPHTIVSGGSTRYQSVKNGLALLTGEGYVAIHDGVRPLIRKDTILTLFREAEIHSNAIPVISPKDSLRWADSAGNRVIDRNFVKIIQTPQVFELNKLKAAYVQEYEEWMTDDAGVWERAGNAVHLAPGQESNLKITDKVDLEVAEAMMRSRAPR